MSNLAKLKCQWNYEKDVARCENCQHKVSSKIILTTYSKTVRVHQHCNIGGFVVKDGGCCDRWSGKDGATLDLPVKKLAGIPAERFMCKTCGNAFKSPGAAADHARDKHSTPKAKQAI